MFFDSLDSSSDESFIIARFDMDSSTNTKNESSHIDEPPNKVTKGNYTWELIATATVDLKRFATENNAAFYKGKTFIRLTSNETYRGVMIEDQPTHLNIVYFNNRNEHVGAESLVKDSWIFSTSVKLSHKIGEFFDAMAERKPELNRLLPLCEEKCCRHLAAVNLLMNPWSLAERMVFDHVALASSGKGLICERFLAPKNEVRVRVHNYWQFMLLIDTGDKLIIRYFDMRKEPGSQLPSEFMKTPFNWLTTLKLVENEMDRFFRR